MKVQEKTGPGYDMAGSPASLPGDSKQSMYHKRTSLDDTDPIERGNNNAAPPQVKSTGKVHG
jgi:hypothetical protein